MYILHALQALGVKYTSTGSALWIHIVFFLDWITMNFTFFELCTFTYSNMYINSLPVPVIHHIWPCTRFVPNCTSLLIRLNLMPINGDPKQKNNLQLIHLACQITMRWTLICGSAECKSPIGGDSVQLCTDYLVYDE